MKHFVGASFALGILLGYVGCSTPRILQPQTGPGTAYPCGFYEHPCIDKTCCANDEVCGGGNFNGCPANACCAADLSRKRAPRPARSIYTPYPLPQ
jgi:hypothetical protein